MIERVSDTRLDTLIKYRHEGPLDFREEVDLLHDLREARARLKAWERIVRVMIKNADILPHVTGQAEDCPQCCVDIIRLPHEHRPGDSS